MWIHPAWASFVQQLDQNPRMFLTWAAHFRHPKAASPTNRCPHKDTVRWHGQGSLSDGWIVPVQYPLMDNRGIRYPVLHFVPLLILPECETAAHNSQTCARGNWSICALHRVHRVDGSINVSQVKIPSVAPGPVRLFWLPRCCDIQGWWVAWAIVVPQRHSIFSVESGA